MGGSQTIGSTCYQYPSDYNFCGRAGVYGTLVSEVLQIFQAAAIPRSPGPTRRQSLALWREGEDSAGNFGDLNDLWEFNPSTNQ